MSPLSFHSILLLQLTTLATFSLAYNSYKDIQRGKTEDTEKLTPVDEDVHLIDHSAQTWPSVGARVYVSSSDKRTINRFKSLKAGKELAGEMSDEDDDEAVNSDKEELASRVLIPRTHALLTDGDIKLKRGPVLWGLQLSALQGLSKYRNLLWILRPINTFRNPVRGVVNY